MNFLFVYKNRSAKYFQLLSLNQTYDKLYCFKLVQHHNLEINYHFTIRLSTVKHHIHSFFSKLYWRWNLLGRSFGIKFFRLVLVKNFDFNTCLVDSNRKSSNFIWVPVLSEFPISV